MRNAKHVGDDDRPSFSSTFELGHNFLQSLCVSGHLNDTYCRHEVQKDVRGLFKSGVRSISQLDAHPVVKIVLLSLDQQAFIRTWTLLMAR